jgi:nicotinate-nucleotide adenylyltransferase
MGGTFDPIHNGHLVAGSEVRKQFDLDRVIFVPTKRSTANFKHGITPEDGEHRYLMCSIACASNPDFHVSRADIDRADEQFTYTINTLQYFRAEFPDTELFFITGADAINDIEDWKDYAQLFDLAQFVLVTRPGVSVNYALLRRLGRPVEILKIPALAISSTDIRARVRAGLPIWYLVPDGIVQYIAKSRLYL